MLHDRLHSLTMRTGNYQKDSNYQVEIERKFLINADLLELNNGKTILQTYLFVAEDKELRVRIVDNSCKMSIKISKNWMSREEFEYTIPIEDGLNLMNLDSSCSPIEKKRYKIQFDNMIWEVDVFKGDNEGLVLAEIELSHEEQEFIKPNWVGEEVTHDKRYYNANLFENPYKNWKKSLV